MASSYSTNLAIELIGTGDQAGTWGTTTNTNLGTLIEQAISGYVTQAVSTGTDTTITIPNGATGVARNMYIELTGTGGASTNLIVPSNKKLYFVFNNTASGQVTVKVSGQTGVSVPNGAKMILVSDGTDIVDATNYVGNISAASGNITTLTSSSATITNLTATSATISNFTFTSATVTRIAATSATVSDLSATVSRMGSATVTNLIATSASITTLTNNPTFGAGTAGGVLYLNGSKEATSGSVFTFDGTNARIGGSGSGARLTVRGTGTTASTFSFEATTSGGATRFVIADDGLTRFYGTSNAETMRLDNAGNLGIGTSSPTARLQIEADSGGNNFKAARGAGSLLESFQSTNGVNYLYTSGASAALVFGTGTSVGSASERMRITSAGNVGIGTSSPTAKLDVVGGNGDGIQYRTGTRTIGIGQISSESSLYWGSTTDLVFDCAGELARITSAGNLGIGTSSPGGQLDVYTSIYKRLLLTYPSIYVTRMQLSSFGYIEADAGNDYYKINAGTAAGSNIRFETSGTERMRIDPLGNVGIGTSSPGNALEIYRASTNATQKISAGGSFGSFLQITNATSTDGLYIGINNSSGSLFNGTGGANGAAIQMYNAVALGFAVGTTERMRIDSSGNLGLAVTPTASTLPQFEGSSNLLLVGRGNTYISNNATFNSSFKYIVNGEAGQYNISGTEHRWNTAASGTAGNPITFTQAMTLDANGRLGIGTTSPAQPLHVDASGGGVVRVTRLGTSASAFGQFEHDGTNTTITSSAATIFNNNSAERARIDSSGRLLIGTTTTTTSSTQSGEVYGSGAVGFLFTNTTAASYAVSIKNEGTSGTRNLINFYEGTGGGTARANISFDSSSNFAIASSNATIFSAGGSERARIDSSGNLLVGATSAAGTERLNVVGGIGIRINEDGLGTKVLSLRSDFAGAGPAVNVSTNHPLLLQTNNTERARITSGGSFQVIADGADSTFTSTGQIALKSNGNNPYISWHQSTGARLGYLQMQNGGASTLSVDANQPLVFQTNALERARITAGGDFYIGNSLGDARLLVSKASDQSEAAPHVRIEGNGYSGYHFLDATAYYIGQNSAARSLRVYSSAETAGVELAAGGTSWGTFSDERLKYDIEPVTNAIESLANIRTVKYRLKDVDSPESKKKIGVIAQDLVGVIDEVVDSSKRPDDETDYLNVRYSELIPVLVKAIQEQQAMIEDLKAKVAALEAK